MSWESIGTVRLAPGLEVPRLGFGGAWIVGPGTFGPPADPDGARRAVRVAVEGGVRLVDTADCYGPEVSETLICEALHPYPTDVVLATKGGRIVEGPDSWRVDGSRGHLRRACEASLRRLRVEQIGLYQLNAVDPGVPVEESVGALAELRDEGKIGAIGLCNVSIAELERARSVCAVAAVQDRFDLTTRGHRDVLDHCAGEGVAFLAWFPPVNPTTAEPAAPLGRVAAAHRATPGQVALAWMLRTGPTTVPLPGTTDPEWEAENLGAVLLELTGAEIAELDGLDDRDGLDNLDVLDVRG